MLRSMLSRTILAGALILGGSAAFMATSAPAQASGMSQYCDQIIGGYCLNAWNGGPLIKAYTSGVLNNNFNVNLNGNTTTIEYMNAGGGLFIGDYNNSSTDAKAGLDGPAGWGTYYNAYPCGSDGAGLAFHNNHWNAWLSSSDSDGSQFYLNTGTAECFYRSTF